MKVTGDIIEQLITHQQLMTFRGHSHSNMEELLICLEGIAAVKQEGQEGLSLSPGQGILLEAGKEHLIWDGSKEKNTRYYNAYFEGESALYISLENRVFNAGELGMTPFWHSFSREDTPCPEKSLHRILSLLLALEKAPAPWVNPARAPRKAQSAGENVREQLRRIIREEPEKNHRLTDLGRFFYLEPKYLSRKIKRLTSLPVMTLYYQVKMEEAKALLLKGNSVKETAYLLGFANPYHFSRKYKEICGKAPSFIKEESGFR